MYAINEYVSAATEHPRGLSVLSSACSFVRHHCYATRGRLTRITVSLEYLLKAFKSGTRSIVVLRVSGPDLSGS